MNFVRNNGKLLMKHYRLVIKKVLNMGEWHTCKGFRTL